jgi:hypothetical protein
MNQNLIDLAKRYSEVQAQSEELSAQLKTVNETWAQVENELLDALAEEGVSSIKLDGIGLVSMRVQNILSVNAANMDGYFAYLKEIGKDDLIKPYINPRTNSAFLKEHLDTLISLREEHGMDLMEAREDAVKFLNLKGASYFVKRGIALKKG